MVVGETLSNIALKFISGGIWRLLGNGVFLIIFSILTIISLASFRKITNRKINNNATKNESLAIIVNSIILVISMGGVVFSGWYTILYYWMF